MADDSGPAYPRVANGGLGYWSEKEGVSMRDYFAAAALPAVANGNNVAAIAQKCYAVADAMLIERAKS